jgi:heme-degrading monooxygenase HmoA
MIRHTVVFRLKHPIGSEQEVQFLEAAAKLASIPGVQRFERLRQTSTKNGFTFGLSMEFSDQNAYQSYSDHPDHTRFVEDLWIPHVEDFLEIDYQLYPGCENVASTSHDTASMASSPIPHKTITPR